LWGGVVFRDLFSKIHKARVDAGLMDGWYFLSRIFPSGYDAECPCSPGAELEALRFSRPLTGGL